MTKPSADQNSQPPQATISGEQTAQPQPPDVEREPFSKHCTQSEFIDWVDEWLQQKATLDDSASLLKRNRHDKRIYEEALPIYYYVRRQYRDRNDIKIELPNSTPNFDAKILHSDGTLIEHVEVTIPFAPTDHLERSQLGAGLTVADCYGSFETYNLDESVRLVDTAISKKLAKPYPAPTVLLVVLPPGLVTEDDDERFNQILTTLQPIPSTSQFRPIWVMECGGAFWMELSTSSTGTSV